MMIRDTTNTTLRQLRESNGWTLIDACRYSGVAPIRLSEYERGIRQPNSKTLMKLSLAYNMKPEEVKAIWKNGLPEGKGIDLK